MAAVHRLAPLLVLLVLAGCPASDFVLEFEGVVLTIPDGALPEGTALGDLNVAVEAELPVPLPDNRSLLSEVYAFTPHGLAFEAPITVDMVYTEAFDGEPEVFRLGDDMDDGWAAVADASFADSVATFTTSGFSWYAVTRLPAGGDDDDSTSADAFEGDIGFDSHAAMTAFCAEYDSVTGSVTIAGPNIAATDELACLQAVGGDLFIQGSGATTVNFAMLEGVGGALVITLNSELDLVSMPFLAEVGGDMLLDTNVQLSSVSLPDLAEIGGSLSAGAQASFLTVDLTGLVDVVGELDLSGPTGMASLNLGALETVGEDLLLSGHTQLTGLDLRSLLSVGGGLDIADEAQLALIQAGRLTSVGGDLVIENSGTLEGVTLPDLTTVGEQLLLLNLESVTSIDLNELETVGGRITVQGTDTIGLSLASLTTAGELRVASNPFASIAAPLLTDVEGDLVVSADAALSTLSFPALVTVGTFFLHDTGLPTLALPELTETSEDFHVAENPFLTSLSAPLLTTIGGSLEIELNPNLPTSQANAIADQADVGGDTTISGNGGG